MNRKKALEKFLNSEVQTLALGLYLWRDKYYEVLPHSLTRKRHNWSQFIKLDDRFSMREASRDVLKRYYPQVLHGVSIDK